MNKPNGNTLNADRVIKLLTLSVVTIILIILPSVFLRMLPDPSETSKVLIFSYAVLIIMGLGLLSLSNTTLIYLEIKRLDIILLLLVLYISINRYLATPYQALSFPFYELIGLVILYLVLRCLKVRYFAYLFLAVSCGAIIQVIHGLLQLWGISPLHGNMITGSFFNSGPYAGYLAICGVLALGMHLNAKEFSVSVSSERQSRWTKQSRFTDLLFQYLPLISLISILLLLPSLRSRAAWIGFIAGAALLLGHKYHNLYIKMKLKCRTIAFIITAMIIIIIAVVYGLYRYKKESANGRFLIYTVTADMIKQHPLAGLGFDRFKSSYMNAQASWFKRTGKSTPASSLAANTYYALNEPLQFLAENGIFGLLILSLLFYEYLYRTTSKKDQILNQLCLAILLAAFIFGSFTYLSGNLAVKINLVLCIATLAKIGKSSKHDIKITLVSIGIIRSAINGIVYIGFVLIGIGLHKNIRLHNGFLSWYLAQENYNHGRYNQSLIHFKKAFPVLQNYGEYLMQYGKALTMAGQYKPAVVLLKRSKLYQNTTVTEIALGDAYTNLKKYSAAERAYLEASYMVPSSFYPNYLLVKLYEISYQHDKARNKAIEIMMKEIKVPSTAIIQMKEEVKAVIKRIK